MDVMMKISVYLLINGWEYVSVSCKICVLSAQLTGSYINITIMMFALGRLRVVARGGILNRGSNIIIIFLSSRGRG